MQSIRLGAGDFLTKPYEIEQVRAIARRSEQRLELQRQVIELQGRLDNDPSPSAIIGASRSIEQLLSQIQRAARASLPVLIRGESGNGKELVARQLHVVRDESSPPAAAPFEAYHDLPLAEARDRLVEDFERFIIERALTSESNNISAAARRLGMHRQSLQQKIKQLGL